MSNIESLCAEKNLSLGISVQVFSGVWARQAVRLPGGPGGPTERAPHVLLDLPITFHPSAAFLSGHWPANIDHAGPEGGDRLVFLAPCVLFLCLVNPVSMETGAAFVLLLLWVNQCFSPPPLFGIKGGGGFISGTDRGALMVGPGDGGGD